MTNLETIKSEFDPDNVMDMEYLYYMCLALYDKVKDITMFSCDTCGRTEGNCGEDDVCFKTFLKWCDRETKKQ